MSARLALLTPGACVQAKRLRAALVMGLLLSAAAAAQPDPNLRFVFPRDGQVVYGRNAVLWADGLPIGPNEKPPAVIFEASRDKKAFVPLPLTPAPDMGLGSQTTTLDSTRYPVGTLYLRARYANEESGPTISVRIRRAPVGDCSAQPGYRAREVIFDCSKSKLGSSGQAIFEWQFGDGEYARTRRARVSHRYAQEGDYSVNAVLTNSLGLTTTISRSLLLRKETTNFVAPPDCGCASMVLKTTGASSLGDLGRAKKDGKLQPAPLGPDPEFASVNYEIEATLVPLSDPSQCEEGLLVKSDETINGAFVHHRACTAGTINRKCNSDSDCDSRKCKGGVKDGASCDDPGAENACLIGNGTCVVSAGGKCTSYPHAGQDRGYDDYTQEYPKSLGVKLHTPNVTWLDRPGFPKKAHAQVDYDFVATLDFLAFVKGDKGACSCHYIVEMSWDSKNHKFDPATGIGLYDPDPETVSCKQR